MDRVTYPSHDTVFTWGAPALKIGLGAVDELGWELTSRGMRRVLLVTDAQVRATGWPDELARIATQAGVECLVFDGVHVEPTDKSVTAAAEFARAHGPFDGFVALGGGSVIDTAKAVNLLGTNGGEVVDYLNPPVGRGQHPGQALQPLIAVPTTAGTGSECTAVSVLDVLDQQVKTGISHPALRPALAVVDPQLTLTVPPEVTAASGMDVLCHALESYTARPYDADPRPEPGPRPVYNGANPISDLWSEHALGLLASGLRAAVQDGDDLAARTRMMLAATYAGMGFGNAGVHLPHANAYPIAGRVRDYRPAGYGSDEALVPHGQAVSLTAPASFRFTFDAAPERHLHAAAVLDPSVGSTGPEPERLPNALVALMRDIGVPNGLGAVGYVEADVDDLVAGTLKQQRLLATAPREATADDIAGLFRASMQLW